MYIMNKILLALSLLTISYQSFCQKNLEKARSALEDEMFTRSLKLAQTAIEDGEGKTTPEFFAIAAKSLAELQKEMSYKIKNPKAIDQAMKYLAKGIKYNSSLILEGNSKTVKQVILLNNEQAKQAFSISNYFKSQRIFDKSYQLNGDTLAYMFLGKLATAMGDSLQGKLIFDTLIQRFERKYEESGLDENFKPDPFIANGDYYWVRKYYDSAKIYLRKGLKFFPNENRINFYLRKIAAEELNNLPPGDRMKDVIQEALTSFPKDTFFTHKENALYVFLVRQAAEKNQLDELEHYIKELAIKKSSRIGDMESFYLKSDAFYDNKLPNIYWKLAKYFYLFDSYLITQRCLKMYVEYTADSAKVLERYIQIANSASGKTSVGFVSQLLIQAHSQFQDEILSDYIHQFVMGNIDKRLERVDMSQLYKLMKEDIKKYKTRIYQTKYTQKVSRLVDLMLRDEYFFEAKKIIDYELPNSNRSDIWEDQYRQLTKKDFSKNYYQTRWEKELYEWNGNTVNCNPGYWSDEFLNKVENRVNYFRRLAGVSPIVLNKDLNDWCQRASLIMRANKKLSHNPPKAWKCYAGEGHYAAQNSLLSKGANPLSTITSFVADNQSNSAGNRRWMLFPNARKFGFGSTGDFHTIWVLDDSGSNDSILYKERFVAWPPEGYVPKMFNFTYWSFGTYQDVKDAKVDMVVNGDTVHITKQEIVDGYGLPTLTWKPVMDLSKYEGDVHVEVKIQLSNGRMYIYKSKLIDVRL